MSKPIIAKGTRIAQMEIVKVPDTEIEIVDHVDENKERGEQGWGSSNKKQ
jgi:dUTPase